MFSESVLLLSLAMVLAIGIERLLEVLRAFGNHLEARSGQSAKWQEKAEQLRNRIELRLNNAGGTNRSNFQKVLLIVCRHLSPAPAETGGLLAISVDKVRSMHIKIRYKLIAIVLGIVFAGLFQLNIFELVDKALNVDSSARGIKIPCALGIVISGIAMGFGAGPVHKMITALERARKTRR